MAHRDDPPRRPHPTQQAVRKNIEQRVAKQLQDLSVEFRRGHKSYLAKLKGQVRVRVGSG